ncbi:MAG: hypothetical protein ABSH51_14125, partial [Solirubrobacteraceae bacterium]
MKGATIRALLCLRRAIRSATRDVNTTAVLVATLTVALAAPAGALAQTTPTASTDSATVTGPRTVILNGQVVTGGDRTTYAFQYAGADSVWCQSGGSVGTPASTTAGAVLAASPNAYGDVVSAQVGGLTAGAGYCDQLVASNPEGTGDGGTVSFTAGSPGADTLDANPGAGGTATVDGEIDPSGQSTTIEVDYDAASSPWCASGGLSGAPADRTPAQTLNAADATDHPVTLTVTGLSPGDTYCAALEADNASGTSVGPPVSLSEGVASTFTAGAADTGPSTAEVLGDVDPAGASTTYAAEYGPAGSPWCESNGAGGSPPAVTAPVSLGVADSQPHTVSVMIAGLTPGTSYCTEVAATNAAGTVDSGSVETFTAGAPSADATDADATGPTTATVDAQIDPAGQATTYDAQYAPASSPWCQDGGSSGTTDPPTVAVALGASDDNLHNVSVALAALSPHTPYCADVIATNASGSTSSSQVSFATAPAPQTSAVTGAATITGAQDAVLGGVVETGGLPTTDRFDYALSSDPWCTSGGLQGTPAQTPAEAVDAIDGEPQTPVSADLTGLAGGSRYCDELVADSAAGIVTGSIMAFTAGL